jgi:4-hydroxybenzoate polyprenyltransferase
MRYPYFAALRPHQWTKNLLVFAAPLFDFSIDAQTLAGSTLAFVLFCFASSGFYLINDIVDVEADRRHPVKSRRPLAAGLVSIPAAVAMAAVLIGSALIIGWLQSPALGGTLLFYALLQTAYNIELKRAPIADIITIAMGFILRAYAGAAATGIIPSPWFLLCTAMLALFIAIEKRKAELRLIELNEISNTRSVIGRYSTSLLTRMESTATSGAVISYALWSAGPMLGGATTPWMLLTLPFVLYGIFRYQLLSDPEEISRRNTAVSDTGGSTERPEELLFTDLPIMVNTLVWVFSVLAILYFTK